MLKTRIWITKKINCLAPEDHLPPSLQTIIIKVPLDGNPSLSLGGKLGTIKRKRDFSGMKNNVYLIDIEHRCLVDGWKIMLKEEEKEKKKKEDNIQRYSLEVTPWPKHKSCVLIQISEMTEGIYICRVLQHKDIKRIYVEEVPIHTSPPYDTIFKSAGFPSDEGAKEIKHLCNIWFPPDEQKEDETELAEEKKHIESKLPEPEPPKISQADKKVLTELNAVINTELSAALSEKRKACALARSMKKILDSHHPELSDREIIELIEKITKNFNTYKSFFMGLFSSQTPEEQKFSKLIMDIINRYRYRSSPPMAFMKI